MITTIILTKNEEKNIADAIISAKQISSRILVIDCGSEDKTQQIAESLGAEVFFHEWPGHAKQFNWALDYCGINTPWVFRLDADERISSELAEEVKAVMNSAAYFTVYISSFTSYPRFFIRSNTLVI